MWIQSPRTGGCFSFRHCWLECQKRVFKVSACWRCRWAVLYYRHIAEWKYVLKLLPAALAWRKLPELAVATPHGVQPHHRSQFRRTAPAKPRCDGQETYGRTNTPPWCRQQDGEVLSLGTKTNARNYRLNCFNASFYEIETFIHPAALRMAVHSCKRTKSTGYVHL